MCSDLLSQIFQLSRRIDNLIQISFTEVSKGEQNILQYKNLIYQYMIDKRQIQMSKWTAWAFKCFLWNGDWRVTPDFWQFKRSDVRKLSDCWTEITSVTRKGPSFIIWLLWSKASVSGGMWTHIDIAYPLNQTRVTLSNSDESKQEK